MNRQQRRAYEAKARASSMRHGAVSDALAVMMALDDPTISGATLILPDGQVLYVPAETARGMRHDGESAH